MRKIVSRSKGTKNAKKNNSKTICAIGLFLALGLGAGACRSVSNSNGANAVLTRYPLKGKVVSVNKAEKKAKIEHEPIEGFMPAMTMDFPIRADWVWEDLVPGVDIRAELVVDNTAKDPYWLENIGIVASPNPNQSPLPLNENFAQVGKETPDFSLVNQDGKKISLKDYRGKALAITFIYAQCPLPEYCIKMSAIFSDLALQLNADTELKDRIRLLSISFDPANDTPEKLRSYGIGYLGNGAKPDFTVWQLAVGTDTEVRRIADFFGLRYEIDPNDKTQFNHSLRTAVIAPDGKVTKIFPGNDWTAADLLRELKAVIE
ncbi:MAG TPA: SCO family protein [Pyrinomonadaceae bacterium]|nr:SCO family protein [Pyrinomonadaceae bacterium]